MGAAEAGAARGGAAGGQPRARVLPHAVSRSPPLPRPSLPLASPRDNIIGEVGARALAEGLTHNTYLRTLNLSCARRGGPLRPRWLLGPARRAAGRARAHASQPPPHPTARPRAALLPSCPCPLHGASTLFPSLCPALLSPLHSRNACAGAAGASAMAECLERNTSLTTLNLS